MVEKQVNKKIRESDAQAIRANLERLKEELRNLRNAKASSGSASKLAKIKGVRRNIARNLTILNNLAWLTREDYGRVRDHIRQIVQIMDEARPRRQGDLYMVLNLACPVVRRPRRGSDADAHPDAE